MTVLRTSFPTSFQHVNREMAISDYRPLAVGR
jgi:hypothetical protein